MTSKQPPADPFAAAAPRKAPENPFAPDPAEQVRELAQQIEDTTDAQDQLGHAQDQLGHAQAALEAELVQARQLAAEALQRVASLERAQARAEAREAGGNRRDEVMWRLPDGSEYLAGTDNRQRNPEPGTRGPEDWGPRHDPRVLAAAGTPEFRSVLAMVEREYADRAMARERHNPQLWTLRNGTVLTDGTVTKPPPQQASGPFTDSSAFLAARAQNAHMIGGSR